MASLDAIGLDLEYRSTAESDISSEEDIGLVDSEVDSLRPLLHSSDPIDRDMGMISEEREERESGIDITSLDYDGQLLNHRCLIIYPCPYEYPSGGYMKPSHIVPRSARCEEILELHSLREREIDLWHTPIIVDDRILRERQCRCRQCVYIHTESIGKERKRTRRIICIFHPFLLLCRESIRLTPIRTIMKAHSAYITYEVTVDRANEKGAFVAREMLSTLHHSLSHQSHWWEFWKQDHAASFRFQIITHDGQIRFYFSTFREYGPFLISQLYAHYPDIEVNECNLPFSPDMRVRSRSLHLHHHDLDTIKLYVNLQDRTEKDSIDPLSSLTSALVKIPKNETGGFIIDFAPVQDHLWRTESKRSLLTSKYIPNFLKLPLLSMWGYIGWIFLPFKVLSLIFGFILPRSESEGESHVTHDHKKSEKEKTSKIDSFGYRTMVHIFKNVADPIHDDLILKELGSSMNIFADPKGNHFVIKKQKDTEYQHIRKIPTIHTQILNTTELAGMIHLPTLYVKTPGVHWVTTRKFEPPHDLPSEASPNTPIGVANYRGDNHGFGIQPVDRARHVYIIGKTGMGKSTLLENMIYTDILNGRGVAVIDPHGDLAETILANIPKSRTNDIVLFDPADQEYPIAFNMLENNRPELRPIVA